jgi:diguanylate cyclase (GGDEF)-like protein
LQGWVALEFLVLGILEAAAIRSALFALEAITLNQDKLEQGAEDTIDPITGCLLPATFEAELALVAALADRKSKPFALIAWEIDGYRAYVNQFGSATGGELMRLTALSIADCLRISDTVGRWDRERFLVILPETTAVDAQRVVDKMRQRVALIEAVDKGPVALRFAIAEHHHGDDPLAVVERVEQVLTDHSGKPNRPAQVISFA